MKHNIVWNDKGDGEPIDKNMVMHIYTAPKSIKYLIHCKCGASSNQFTRYQTDHLLRSAYLRSVDKWQRLKVAKSVIRYKSSREMPNTYA